MQYTLWMSRERLRRWLSGAAYVCLSLAALLATGGCQPLTRPPAEQVQVTSPTPGAAGLGDPLFPWLGNGGYDVQHYALDLDVDPVANLITGTATIQAQAVQDLSTFNLDLHGLVVRDVQVDAANAGHQRIGNELMIVPTSPISAGSLFTAVVSYGGFPVPVLDPAAPMRVGWQRQPGGSFVASEPSGAMSWYPNNNHPRDKATYTLRVTAPDPYVVAANGVLVSTVPSPGANTFVWEMKQPMASYLATVHVGAYDVASVTTLVGDTTLVSDTTLVGDTTPSAPTIRNYFPKGTPTEVRAKFDETPAMIEFMEDLIAPYPFDAYGAILLAMPTRWALETQTLSIFGAQGPWSQEVVMHELVHSWFGNSVSPATWQDVWLNEGFATYFSALWLDHTGERPLAEYMSTVHERLEMREVGPPALVSAADLFGDETYLRGAYSLYALHQDVGDGLFFAVMREYYARHAGGNASTADLLAVVQELGGDGAAALLTVWLYDEAPPPAAPTGNQPDAGE